MMHMYNNQPYTICDAILYTAEWYVLSSDVEEKCTTGEADILGSSPLFPLYTDGAPRYNLSLAFPYLVPRQ